MDNAKYKLNDDMHVRMNSEVKQQFLTILEQLGVRPSIAFDIFVRLVIQEKALPFKSDGLVKQVINEAMAYSKMRKHDSNVKYTDFTGQKFGKLTVIEKTDERKHGNIIWKCQCECGAISLRGISEIKRGTCVQCAKNKKDLTGQKFGKLTALERVGMNKNQPLWKCQCECGKEIVVKINHLIGGNVRGCGCLKRDVIRSKGKYYLIIDKLLPENEQQKQVLSLYKTGKTYQEIAKEMGCSSQYVGQLMKLMALNIENNEK